MDQGEPPRSLDLDSCMRITLALPSLIRQPADHFRVRMEKDLRAARTAPPRC